ncbi:transposable element Tcb1 transposase [Trichonephila clavipes]|nr:transposable element Tcb1 transposase [Trichonephila clavipes]
MSFTRRPGSGHPRQTSCREDRHIIRNAHVQPTASSATIQAQVAPSLGAPVSSNHTKAPPGERLDPAFALQRHTAPTAGVMVLCAIAYNTRSPLVLIHGPMTAQRYVHDILQPHVLPLMQRLPGAIFQQDNARPPTARVSQDCFRTFTTVSWYARSTDSSPIEHI